MIQDGWGYGKSNYWPYVAKKVAKDESEECEHIDNQDLLVKIRYMYDPNSYNVKIKVRCASCFETFPKTSQKVKQKFLEFYGK